METFYFNTGVNPYLYPPIAKFGQVNRGGTVQIPFDCENVPENSTFLFACDDENASADENTICREIHNSGLISKYAFFRTNK